MGKEITLKDLLVILLINLKKIGVFTAVLGIIFALIGVFQAAQGQMVKKVLLFLIVGIVIGFIGSFIVIAIIEINSPILASASDIRRRYNIPVLAVIPKQIVIDKNNFVEKLVSKLKSQEYSTDCEKQIQIAIKSLKVISKQHKVILTGSVSQNENKELIELLCEDDDSKFQYGECILEDPYTIEILSDKDGVVLVEKINETNYEKLNRQIFQLEALNKEVYGIILL